LFYFTGTHNDYHKPSDDEDKINYYGVKNITDYVFRTTQAIENLPQITFTKTKSENVKQAPKYKVTLGIMPDYTDHGDGLHIDGVTENRPAALAGIVAGDILTKIGDCVVKEVYGYMECLSKINAGETKKVEINRNGQVLTVDVTF
jgi:S1-C subfamily serine protease